MGYCGLKIAGHSLTDFKNRKAFSKSKKILNHQPIFNNVRIEQREASPKYSWFFRLKLFISIVGIFTIVLLISVYGMRLNYFLGQNNHVTSEGIDKLKQKENQEAAIMMFSSAQQYFNSSAFNHA
jgi:hypothetical protein